MACMDEDLHAKVLAFVSSPVACVSCRAWKTYLYDSLQLQHRIRFNQTVAKGKLGFSYNAVRPLAEDFEESVGYHFEFAQDHTYKMQWTRTFDSWSSQSEQQVGCWKIIQDQILCETEDPNRPVGEREVRFAPAGWIYSVAIDDILVAEGQFYQEKIGAPRKPWETTARLGRMENDSGNYMTGTWQAPTVSADTDPSFVVERANPNAMYVEIDGELHEVSGDIVANCPEEQWANLMRCRLRFGING